MSSKRYRALVKERPAEALPLPEAVAFVKSRATAKFDETVELHVRLAAGPKAEGGAVRGTVQFPHGAPKAPRVAVFAHDEKAQKAATEAGADLAGGAALIEEVKAAGALAADVAVATPDIMKDLAPVAKILGPKGLMPNPKTGTIAADPAEVVRALKGGRMAFAADASGGIHLAIGKASWETEKIVANARAALEAIRAARPSLQSVTITSTMGPSVTVRV